MLSEADTTAWAIEDKRLDPSRSRGALVRAAPAELGLKDANCRLGEFSRAAAARELPACLRAKESLVGGAVNAWMDPDWTPRPRSIEVRQDW